MEKSQKFKEWFNESDGHNLQLKLAYEAILELESSEKAKEREIEELISRREYWESKASELAYDVAEFFSTDIGEHSNANCPVSNAIDALGIRMEHKPKTITYKCPKCEVEYEVDSFSHCNKSISNLCGECHTPMNPASCIGGSHV